MNYEVVFETRLRNGLFCLVSNRRIMCLFVFINEGLGCSTVIYPEAAAICAAQMLALNDPLIWARLRVRQCHIWADLKKGTDAIF